MELSDYRKELDSIDAQMLELFKQRMNTVRGVAEYKKENKLPVLQQGRLQKTGRQSGCHLKTDRT